MKTEITATDARRDFFEIVKGATEKHEIFRIQHRRGPVVLLSAEDYDNLIETLELLSTQDFSQRLRQSIDQVHKGETYSMEEVFGNT
ncbi:MAG: type II toxin-antitoxin system Phd/YefM family antitoxin [Deltaproteobacteria bacterium]|nr:type II toxin-antitoxin system Phd/YefM family antitoxin [Deltaproteobacteria bacterium]